MNMIKVFLMAVLIGFGSQVFADESMTDGAINNRVKEKIAMDQSLTEAHVKVDVNTDKQVVTLTGTVNSDTEASTLIEIAESTLGVKDVDTTNLVVKESKQPISDIVITSKVKGTFVREKLFGKADIPLMGIKVETNNAVVYLSGEADSKAQIDDKSIAKSAVVPLPTAQNSPEEEEANLVL